MFLPTTVYRNNFLNFPLFIMFNVFAQFRFNLGEREKEIGKERRKGERANGGMGIG